MSAEGQQHKSRKRTILWTTAVITLIIVFGAAGLAWRISSVGRSLFKLNKKCQEEGYYMAEFEMKVMGFLFELDRGHYAKSFSDINALHEQLSSRQGLIKVPRFNDQREEMEFYIALQNPRTGAFMDDSYPYCTYDPPTQNVLLHLEKLSKTAGQPLQLKYPLTYLDEINTPAKLTAFLDDVANVGPLAAWFPQTSFFFARELLSYGRTNNVLERNNLYRFSQEWRQALLQWFYTHQDPASGFWGPKSRNSGKLLKLDLDNTASIVKTFVDRDGRDIHPSFPLRYKPEMFRSVLKVMSEPVPGEDDLGRWHEWGLKMTKGTRLLIRYLWSGASEENRIAAANVIENYLQTEFDKFFVQNEGAFSYYPNAQHATLDGTSSGFGVILDLGALSTQKQQRLWGATEKTCTDLGRCTISVLTENDYAQIIKPEAVNSVRFYSFVPQAEEYATGADGLFYPRPTPVLDIRELAPLVTKWLEATSQSMGNWASKAEMLNQLPDRGMGPVPVWKGEIPLARLNEVLKEHKTLTMIGFDLLQVPRYKITFSVL